MVDMLVRGLDEETARWLKSIARRESLSLNDVARQALEERARRAKERRATFWRELETLRSSIGPLDGDSVDVIREFRESR